MADILTELKDALKELEGSVKKDLQEIQQQKAAVQQMVDELNESAIKGKIIRDDNRIILSAPEVIIGNVDTSGELSGPQGGSTVIIRGGNVSLEGVGRGGRITQRAPQISSLAVDPGTDGTMEVVYENSQIVSQARGITLQSNEETGCFISPALGASGVSIQSDTRVNIHATPSVKNRKKAIDDYVKALEASGKDLQTASDEAKKRMESLMKDVQDLVDKQEKHNGDEDTLCTDYDTISEMSDQFKLLESELINTVSQYVRLLTQQAEVNRRQTALKATKDEIEKKEADFETKGISTSVSIEAESVSVTGTDGDGNLRENPEAGLSVQMPHISMVAHDKKGQTMKDSFLYTNVQDVLISTTNTKLDDKREKGDILCEGSFTVNSKQVVLKALDREMKDKKVQEKALTKDGTIMLRTENVILSGTDTEGKSTGRIEMNAKDIKLAAMDVDKEKRTELEMAKGSQMVLLSEKMFVGSNKEKKAAELVQVAAKQVGIMGKETAEMQEGESKSVITLNGGNVTAGGSAVSLQGNTTIEGNADIKGETKTPKLSSDQVEAKSAFKSPNINDTMGAGAPGAAGKPSAKLKEEEAKEAAQQ